MYDNIGKKIKLLAQIVCIVLGIASVIVGSILWYGFENGWFALLVFGGPIAAWAISLITYGFGELVDRVCDIEKNISKQYPNTASNIKVDEENKNKLSAQKEKEDFEKEEQRKQKEIEKQEKEKSLKRLQEEFEKAHSTSIEENRKKAEAIGVCIERTDSRYSYFTCPVCEESVFFYKDENYGNCPYCDSKIKINKD